MAETSMNQQGKKTEINLALPKNREIGQEIDQNTTEIANLGQFNPFR